MRVFQYDLPRDVEKYIFLFLTPLDICMARAVSKGWRNLVQSLNYKAPTFRRDFLHILPQYDCSEYITAVEEYTYYRFIQISLKPVEDFAPLIDAGAIYSMLYALRIFTIIGNIKDCVWATCVGRPETWDRVLLLRLSEKRGNCIRYFWDSVKTNNVAILEWMVKRNLVDFNSDKMFKEYWIGPFRLHEIRKSLEFLHICKRVPRYFITRYIIHVWSKLERIEDNNFISLLELFQFVPPDVCMSVTNTEHDAIRHICGCKLNGPNLKMRKIK